MWIIDHANGSRWEVARLPDVVFEKLMAGERTSGNEIARN